MESKLIGRLIGLLEGIELAIAEGAEWIEYRRRQVGREGRKTRRVARRVRRLWRLAVGEVGGVT